MGELDSEPDIKMDFNYLTSMFITLYKLESLYNSLALGRLRSIYYCILVQNIPLSILGVIDNVEWTIMW